MHETSAPDRRIQKTRALLLEAIGALIHEKSYDQIAVKEILHRANVGRSTFYEHFRDKDELLSGAMNELLRGASAGTAGGPRALGFSRPLLEHIQDRRRAGGFAGVDAHARAVLHERLQHEIARLVEEELARSGVNRKQAPTELLVAHIAASFVLVVDWWMESGCAQTVTEVDELFRTLISGELLAAVAR